MKFLRVLLACLSLVCLAAWLWLRQPYSPTQELPPVLITAFEVAAPSPAEGEALSALAQTWRGVTAASYNPASQLLVLTHEEAMAPTDLLTQLQAQTAVAVSQKIFPAPLGPKCPVPQAALTALPGYLLAGGLGATFLFALSFLGVRRKVSLLTPNTLL